MRFLTALLCVAYTRAYMVLPDTYPFVKPALPPAPVATPSNIYIEPINVPPHRFLPDDTLYHVRNSMSSRGYPKTNEHHESHGMGYILPLYDLHTHHDVVYPHEYMPHFKYPVEIPAIESQKENRFVYSDSKLGPYVDLLHDQSELEQPNMSNDIVKYIAQVDKIEHNLKAAMKLAADLTDDTHIDSTMTLLDTAPHYNAILAAVFALAEDLHSPSAPHTDFDTFYDGNYIRAVEEYYPIGLLNPGLVSQKVEYYTKLFNKKIYMLKQLIDGKCRPYILPCKLLLAFKIRSHSYDREANVLEALADLAVAYEQIAPELMNVSEKYEELPYLLHNKEDLRPLVKKFHRVLDLTTHQKRACQETQDDPMAPLKLVPLK